MTFHAFWLDLPHISLHKILLYTTERCCRTHACCILIILLFPPSGCPRVWEITDPSDSMQDSCSLSQLIFPINISLCAEEQAAVQLMIWITAACHPAIPAACWEPNSLLVLRSVTHAPAPPPPHPHPSPLVIQLKDALRSNDRCLAPPSFCFSFVILLSCRLTPSSLRLLQHPTVPPCTPTPQTRTRSTPPLTKDRRRLI